MRARTCGSTRCWSWGSWPARSWMDPALARPRARGRAPTLGSLRRRSRAHGATLRRPRSSQSASSWHWSPVPRSSPRSWVSPGGGSGSRSASTSRLSGRRCWHPGSTSRAGRSCTRTSSGAPCWLRSRRSSCWERSPGRVRSRCAPRSPKRGAPRFRLGSLAVSLVALGVIGTAWRRPGEPVQVLVVPLSGALTAVMAVRLSRPSGRRLSSRGVAIVALACVVTLAVIGLSLPRTRRRCDGSDAAACDPVP